MFILDLHFPDCLVYLKGFFGLELLRRVSPGTLANSTYASIYIYISLSCLPLVFCDGQVSFVMGQTSVQRRTVHGAVAVALLGRAISRKEESSGKNPAVLAVES